MARTNTSCADDLKRRTWKTKNWSDRSDNLCLVASGVDAEATGGTQSREVFLRQRLGRFENSHAASEQNDLKPIREFQSVKRVLRRETLQTLEVQHGDSKIRVEMLRKCTTSRRCHCTAPLRRRFPGRCASLAAAPAPDAVQSGQCGQPVTAGKGGKVRVDSVSSALNAGKDGEPDRWVLSFDCRRVLKRLCLLTKTTLVTLVIGRCEVEGTGMCRTA